MIEIKDPGENIEDIVHQDKNISMILIDIEVNIIMINIHLKMNR